MTDSTLAAAVIEADDRRYRAMIDQDLEALDALLSDDLVYLHSTGAMDGKASLIAALKERKFTFRSAETHDTGVRTYGDAAVLNGKVRLVVDVAGTDHHVTSTFTTVWVKQGAGVRLVHWQSTPLPKA